MSADMMQCRPAIRFVLLVFLSATGCTSSLVQSDSVDAEVPLDEDVDGGPQLVGDIARATGFRPAKVRSFALVTNLRGTGSDPDPSGPKDMVVDDMRRRGVRNPHEILAEPTNAIVVVEAILPPAAQVGDRIDVKVSAPPRSKTTDLHNGWLMKSRLQEMAVLDNRIRSGNVVALAQGAVLTNAMLNGEESDISKLRGTVLGGGHVTKARSLGLALRKESHSVAMSRLIGDAINRRFHTFDRGIKTGAAVPKRDSFIELAVQPQYRNNLVRYIRVVESLAIKETTNARFERISRLRDELTDPAKNKAAALQLEAIGHEASSALLSGLQQGDMLGQFYCAEALAYLNHEAAIDPLKYAAANESSLRWRALAALSAMTKHPAREALSELLHVESAESRYGAFRSLQDANPRDPAVQGENVDDVLALHVVPTNARPMVHIRKTERPEIVVFGSKIELLSPFVASAGKKIMVKSKGDQVKVTRFAVSENRTMACPNNLADIVRAIVQVGGDYAEVVHFINDAKNPNGAAQPCLHCRVEFDAIPRTGRTFHRESEQDQLAKGSQDETLAAH